MVAQSLLALLHEPIQVDQHQLSVSASIGIAVFPEDATDTESLCIAADLRMYSSKQGASSKTALHTA